MGTGDVRHPRDAPGAAHHGTPRDPAKDAAGHEASIPAGPHRNDAAAARASSSRFRHDLIQRFVYGSLDDGQRTYLHEAVADALVDLHGAESDPVALALHYTLAKAPERAAAFHRQAGDRARASGALPDAVGHYRAALEQWDRADDAELAELRHALGECLQIRGERDSARPLLLQAREGYLRSGNRRKAALAQIETARAIHDFGEPQAALDASREALELVHDEPECWEKAYAMSALAMFHGFAYHHDEAIAWGERALAMARRLQARAIEAHALNRVGTILAHFRPERRNEGLSMLASGQRLVEGLDARELAGIMVNLADALQGLGRTDAAMRHYDHYLAYTERLYAQRDTDTRLQRWRLQWRSGRWAEAAPYLDYLRQRVAGTDGWLRFRLPYAIASADLDLGRPGCARATVSRHEAELPAKLLLPLRAAAQRELLRACRDADPARADRYALDLIDGMAEASEYFHDVIAPVTTALTWIAWRPSSEAQRRLPQGFRVLEQVEHQYGSPESRAAVSQAHAAMASASGADAAAARAYLRSAECWQETGFPLDEARARSTAGHALLRLGSRREAGRALARADRLLTSLLGQLSSADLIVAFGRQRQALLRPSPPRAIR